VEYSDMNEGTVIPKGGAGLQVISSTWQTVFGSKYKMFIEILKVTNDNKLFWCKLVQLVSEDTL
jgi:hypothetical protein